MIIILIFAFGGEKFLPEWESSLFDEKERNKLAKEYFDKLSDKEKTNDESLRYL